MGPWFSVHSFHCMFVSPFIFSMNSYDNVQRAALMFLPLMMYSEIWVEPVFM